MAPRSPSARRSSAAKIRGRTIVLAIGGDAPTEIAARHVVLAAGLAAPRLARAIAGLDPATVPTALFRQGQLFLAFTPRRLFRG